MEPPEDANSVPSGVERADDSGMMIWSPICNEGAALHEIHLAVAGVICRPKVV
jgi:hypothetical protein